MVQRTRFKVAYNDYRQKWVLLKSEPSGFGQGGFQEIAESDTKKEMVRSGRTQAKSSPNPSKLLVEKMNGRLSEESNYKPAEGEYYR